MGFKLLFVECEVLIPNPFNSLGIMLGLSQLHPLVNKALDTKAHDVFVHHLAIPALGYEREESFPQLSFDGLEQLFVVARETDHSQELHALVLQVVTVQVLEHFVKQPGEHRVIFPNLHVGFDKLLACLHSHFCEAFMLNEACNYVFAEIEQLFTVVLLVALVHHD